MRERRRFPRIRFERPMRATIGESAVYIVDASAGGFSVVHISQLGAPGHLCRLEIPSNFGPIVADCEVVRTTARGATKTQPPRQLYISGLAVLGVDHQSAQRLRTLFA